MSALCIDEDWDGCNQEGRGERLINEAGELEVTYAHLLSMNKLSLIPEKGSQQAVLADQAAE